MRSANRNAAVSKAIWAGRIMSGSSLFGHVLFPVYVAALIWGALYLREDRLRTLLSLRNRLSP
jgi:hypothetical protein